MKVKVEVIESGFVNIDTAIKEEAERVAEEMYRNSDFLFDEEGMDDFTSDLIFTAMDDKPKNPICPLNLYFEGDEHKCKTSKCNFDTERRGCTEACKIVTEGGSRGI